jgi:hypothetical protein
MIALCFFMMRKRGGSMMCGFTAIFILTLCSSFKINDSEGECAIHYGAVYNSIKLQEN